MATELVMNAMDTLFDLYNEYIDRLESEVRRTHQTNPAHGPPSALASRMTRHEFDQYLGNGRETEAKRLFLKRLVRDDDRLLARLPDDLQTLAKRAA